MITMTLAPDKRTFKLYVDGVERGSKTVPVDYDTYDRNLGLGWSIYSQRITHGFGGLIDEVGIWDRELTASEVAQLYGSQRVCKNIRPEIEFPSHAGGNGAPTWPDKVFPECHPIWGK